MYLAGAEGGAEAAFQLHDAVKKHLADLYPDDNTARWNVLCNIYYNMEGLASKLRAVGVLRHPTELANFARAFGLNQPLFTLIDVGVGKERADAKLRETFRIFLPNLQCKHIIFGPSHDNGYLPVLDPLKNDRTTSAHLSLLETLPAQSGFKALGFPLVRFPAVFRSQNLPDKPFAMNSLAQDKSFPMPIRTQSNHTISPPPQQQMQIAAQPLTNVANKSAPYGAPSISPVPSNGSNEASWAAVGKKAGAGTKEFDIAPKKQAQAKYILVNAYDERVDESLPRFDKAAMNRLYQRVSKHKVCNDYHINGHCETGEYCDYDHGERLSKGEQLALMHQARKRCCSNESECNIMACVSGHICPGGQQCYGSTCFFARFHNVDPTPAWKVYEDGRKELVKKA